MCRVVSCSMSLFLVCAHFNPTVCECLFCDDDTSSATVFTMKRHNKFKWNGFKRSTWHRTRFWFSVVFAVCCPVAVVARPFLLFSTMFYIYTQLNEHLIHKTQMRNKRTTLNCLRNSHFDPSHCVRSFVRLHCTQTVWSKHLKKTNKQRRTTNNSNSNNDDDDDGDDDDADENTGIVTMPDALAILFLSLCVRFNLIEKILNESVGFCLPLPLPLSPNVCVCALCRTPWPFHSWHQITSLTFIIFSLSHFAHSFPIQIFLHIVVHARTPRERERYLKHRIGCEAIDSKKKNEKKNLLYKKVLGTSFLAVILGRRLLSFSFSCVCVCFYVAA